MTHDQSLWAYAVNFGRMVGYWTLTYLMAVPFRRQSIRQAVCTVSAAVFGSVAVMNTGWFLGLFTNDYSYLVVAEPINFVILWVAIYAMWRESR